MTCILTVNNWDGELPQIGEFVKAVRGRTAFMIVEIRRPSRPARYVAKFVCERYPADCLSPEAVIHSWKWSRRG